MEFVVFLSCLFVSNLSIFCHSLHVKKKKHLSFPERSAQAGVLINLDKITEFQAGGCNCLESVNEIQMNLCCFSQCARW